MRYASGNMRPNRELLKGSTPILILTVLSEGPCHGYAVAREIERRTSHTLSLGEGSLYPALHGLERDGLIGGSWEIPLAGGPARKVYTLTETGQIELAKRRQSWREFVGAIEDVLSGSGTTPLPDPEAV